MRLSSKDLNILQTTTFIFFLNMMKFIQCKYIYKKFFFSNTHSQFVFKKTGLL